MAAALILLQLAYLVMVAVAAAATCAYVLVVPAVFAVLHFNVISIFLALAPLGVGGIVTFFLLKPLLARPLPRPDAFAPHHSTSACPGSGGSPGRACSRNDASRH